MNVWSWALGGVAAACFATYAASPWTVFSRAAPATVGLLWIKVAATASGVAQIWIISTTNPGHIWRYAAACGLFLGSMTLFSGGVRATHDRPLTVAFSTDEPRHIETTGPYRRIRHPFYASYLLAYLAGWVATDQILLLVTVVAMLALYAAAARREEAKFRSSPLAKEYRRYAQRTGMLVPRAHHRRTGAP